jgi:hypothetical protein
VASSTFSRSPVLGYWLVKDAVTGHSAIVGKLESSSSAQTPLLSSTVYQQLGANVGDSIQSYYLGGDPKNLLREVEKGLGKLQVSTDTIPGSFTALLHNGIQGVNFDLLTPTGVNANAYQQEVSKLGHQAEQTTSTVGKVVGSFAQAFAGWDAFRFLKLIGGLLLGYFGLRQLAVAAGTIAGAP